MSALHHPAARGDRGCGRKRGLWSGFGESVDEHEPHRLFDSEFARGDRAIFQSLCDDLVRAFVFLPGAHVGVFAIWCVVELFARASFFKRRAYVERRALCRQHQREHAFTAPPVHAGEIPQRRAFHHHDGVERILRHQLARVLLACLPFFPRDRLGFALARLQLRNRWRKGSVAGFVARRREPGTRCNRDASHTPYFKKSSPRDHEPPPKIARKWICAGTPERNPLIIGELCDDEFAGGFGCSVQVQDSVGFVRYAYKCVCTTTTKPGNSRGVREPPGVSSTIPFPEPETALPAMIDPAARPKPRPRPDHVPVACKRL